MELLTYKITKEVRKGPFGLIRQQTPLGAISVGMPSKSVILSETAGLMAEVDYNYETLKLHQAGAPVRVDFAAEPQRRRPAVSAVLNDKKDGKSEIFTSRRKVTAYEVGNPNERYILEAPKVEVLTINTEQLPFFIANVTAKNRIEEDRRLMRLTAEETIRQLKVKAALAEDPGS